MPEPATGAGQAPLIFLHVPKAGGNTLERILMRHYPADRTVQVEGDNVLPSVERLRALPEAERHRIRLLCGHPPFGLHTLLAPGARYVTLLREPVSRIDSHYQFVLRRPRHYLHAQVAARKMSLRDYALSDLSPELDNGQTRLLAGIWDARPIGEAELAQALANLESHFVLAAPLERFDEAVIELGLRLRWWRLWYRNYNVHARADRTVPGAVAAEIAQRNRFDVQLYEAVCRRFDAAAWPARLARRGAAGVLAGASQLAARLRPAAGRTA